MSKININIDSSLYLPLINYCTEEIDRLRNIQEGDIFKPYGYEKIVIINKDNISLLHRHIKQLEKLRSDILESSTRTN